jgi:hypothetical protein
VNWGKSTTSVCQQVAALVPEMFNNFYLMKNHQIPKHSATIKAREKNMHRFLIREFYEKKIV